MNYAEWEKEINNLQRVKKELLEKVIFMLGFWRWVEACQMGGSLFPAKRDANHGG